MGVRKESVGLGHYKGNTSGRTVLRKYEKAKKGCANCIWDISKSLILPVNIMDIAISATLSVMNPTLQPLERPIKSVGWLPIKYLLSS